MDLGSTQPLVKMSTRNTSWGQRLPVRDADNLTTFMCRMSWKSGSLNLLEPSGPHRACYGTALRLIKNNNCHRYSLMENISYKLVSIPYHKFLCLTPMIHQLSPTNNESHADFMQGQFVFTSNKSKYIQVTYFQQFTTTSFMDCI
jgi:hypothetical protein